MPSKEGASGREEGGGRRTSAALENLVWLQEQEQPLGVDQVGSHYVKVCMGQGGHRAKEAEPWRVSSL